MTRPHVLGGIDRMSDVYRALRRTVGGIQAASVAQATRNARREVHELAAVMAQVDALERRLARTGATAPAVVVRDPERGRAA